MNFSRASLWYFSEGDGTVTSATITGTTTKTVEDGGTVISIWDLSVKVGWNIAFLSNRFDEATNTKTETLTTTDPGGLKWYFRYYGENN
ncbi:hypothetical protein AGMMS49982_06060 [Bacteroidia bacterium]|nr:hypothetical protein AGMMS49982_06060 [Bacteroidia bacterium]